MRMHRLLAATVCAAAVASPAMADSDFEPRFLANVSVGWNYFDDQRQFSEQEQYAYGAEFRLTPNWAAELTFVRGETKAKYRSDDEPVGASADRARFNEIRVDGLYYFNRDFGWQPYAAAGIGEAWFNDVENTRFGERDEVRLNAGGGMRYIVTEMISLRGDIRTFYGPRDDTFDATASAGISFAFRLD